MAAKAKTVTFHSKFGAYTITRIPKLQRPLATGGWETTQAGVGYEFKPVVSIAGNEQGVVGVLTLKEGQDKLKTDHERFLADGEEVGVERDAIEALKASRAYGRDFWLAGHAPGTLYPRDVDFRAEVRRATVKVDEAALVKMIEAERKSHGRVDLLAEAEDALVLVREAIASVTPKVA